MDNISFVQVSKCNQDLAYDDSGFHFQKHAIFELEV